jgi:2-C-methyl-D-erythritol 4-phosphate cytidylyltransferase
MTSRQISIAAVIVAAGRGVRMGITDRKQYMLLAGIPVLSHTVFAFDSCQAIDEIYLVIPDGEGDLCRTKVVEPLRLRKPLHMVAGGQSRQESVLRGLRATKGRFDIICIHDGVRPLVSIGEITSTIHGAERYGACVVGIPSVNSVKAVDKSDSVVATLKRETVRLVQTPQAFRYEVIYAAHMAARTDNYVGTDDAELVERHGRPVRVVPGSPRNIKITTRQDLVLAAALLDTAPEDIAVSKQR